MNNNIITPEPKTVEPGKTQSSLRWSRTQIWFAPLGFWIFALALGHTFRVTQRFPNDLFIANWLSGVLTLFFASGWLLTHCIELVAFKSQKWIVIVLVIVSAFGSLFFCIFFERFSMHPVLSKLGLDVTYLILSGACLRVSVFRDESFSFLLRMHPFNNGGKLP